MSAAVARTTSQGSPAATGAGVRRVSFEVSDESPSAVSPTECVISLGRKKAPPAGSETIPESLLSLTKVKPVELPEVPQCFLCPISQKVMVDPVVAADGVTYEREQIEAALRAPGRGHVSPATGRPLPSGASSALRPDGDLKAAIQGYLELRSAVEIQWKDVEASMDQYMSQVNQRMESNQRKVRELHRQIQVMESGRGGRSRGLSCSTVSTTASLSPATPAAAGGVAVPSLLQGQGRIEESPAASQFTAGPAPRSARGEKPTPRLAAPREECPAAAPAAAGDAAACQFTAGPAPRSARGERPTPRPGQHQTPRQQQQQQGPPQGRQSQTQSAFAGLRAAFTPRLFVRSPRCNSQD